MIEPFAIWNLIQNALAAAESAPAKTPTNDEEKAETAQNSSAEKSAADGAPEAEKEAAPNACESYLLRHEQLSRKHNNGR